MDITESDPIAIATATQVKSGLRKLKKYLDSRNSEELPTEFLDELREVSRAYMDLEQQSDAVLLARL